MDEAAFEGLFREHYGRLCSFAASIVSTREDAEDVVQQVFTNLWQVRASLRVRTSIRAYLYRAVRNGSLNRLRGSRATVDLDPAVADMPDHDPWPDPDRLLIARETAERLHAAMARLGPRCRQVLRLRWIDGLSHAEIADTLGITRKAVESNITRGLHALREFLADPSDPPD